MADTWSLNEPTTFELFSNSLGSLSNSRNPRSPITTSLDFGKQNLQCEQDGVITSQHNESSVTEIIVEAPIYKPESEEDQMRCDFDMLDVKRQGVLDANEVSKIMAQYVQRVDLPTIERLMRNFAGGSSVVGFSNLLIIYQFLKRIKKVFQYENTLPANQAPSILQAVLPPDQHTFISSAIQKWLKSYYTEKITHQGLRGLSQDGFGKFRDLDHPLDPKDGLNFHNVLQMALDAIEKKNSMSPFS